MTPLAMTAPELRPAHNTPTECTQLAAVQVQSWRVGYQGLLPQDYLAGLSVQQRAKRWARVLQMGVPTWVTVQDERVTGFISYGAGTDTDAAPSTGEIYALYIAPPYWRQGHGSLLLQHGLHALAALDYRQVWVWMLAGNARARRFYAQAGFVQDGPTRTDTFQSPRQTIRFAEVRLQRGLG